METPEVTRSWSALRRSAPGARGRLHLGRVEAVRYLLPAAAFLFGVAVAAVAFVGVWKHTAARSDQVQLQQARTAKALRQTRGRLAHTELAFRAARTSLAAARRREATLGASVSRARNAAAARQIEAGRLNRRLEESASALAQHAATLSSDLSALEGYLSRSGQSIDPAFLDAQISYLIRAGRVTEQDASKLQADAAAALRSAQAASSRTR